MSKELEALNKIAKQIELDEDTDFWEIRNAHKTVEQALQRLEAIDNANPSEAFKKLDDISYLVLNEIDDLKNKELWKSYFNTIKQALIKSQEQEKVLNIINNKVMSLVSVEDGCVWDNELYQYNKLTQEEFELLKRYLEQ